jgi:predicted amidohydrolase
VTTALTLSAIQYTALDGGIAANVAEHIRLIEDADDHGARFVLFPELSLTGYDPAGLADPERWVTAADPRLDGLREICRRTGITAVVGAPFREADGTPRLASLALHPNGGLDTGFKVWLHGPEQQFFRAGDHAVILDLDGWKIALAICLDTARPVHAADAAEAGADVYASRPSTPRARTTGWPCTWERGPWTTACSACSRTSAAPPDPVPPRAGAVSGDRTDF